MLLLAALSYSILLQAPVKRDRLFGHVGTPYKVVLADFTGDNKLDAVVGYRQVGVVAIERGDGSGRLRPLSLNVYSDQDRKLNPDDKTWSAPHIHNLATADVDKDGRVDLAFTVGGLNKSQYGRVIVARNLDGRRLQRMAEFHVPSQAKGIALTDMDGDGRQDLLYTARGSGYKNDLTRGILYVRRGLGNWRFGPAVVGDAGRSAYYIETVDINGDKLKDIVIPNEHDSTVTIIKHPRRIFSRKKLHAYQVRTTQIPGRRSHAVNDVRVAELNNDGKPDLITANLGTSTISVFLGRGDGTFKKDVILEGGKNCAFLAIGDFDHDGDNDFAVTHWTEDFLSVFLNRGNATFSQRRDYKTGSGNYGVTVGDLNRDGKLDMVTANYRGGSISVLLGLGNGQFKPAVTQSRSLRHIKGRWVYQK